jgi:hypothetical protein
MQVSGSGLLEFSSYETFVEAIVASEGTKNPIPGYSLDDIAQEIRLECWRVMQFYDPQRIGPYPYKYLQVCIKNFLYNMRRGTYVPNNPPCVRCPMWDKLARKCIVNEEGCDSIVQYRKKMATKANLKSPAPIENEVYDIKNEAFDDSFALQESILQKMPKELLPYYKKMIGGEKRGIPVKARKEIRKIVKELLKDAEDF